MAITMLVLLGTAFLPIAGIAFDWIDIHWIAGCVLILLVLFHIVHMLARRSIRLVWVGPRDLGAMWNWLRGRRRKPGKYTLAQRLYHNGIALFMLALCVTGALMLLKIDTPWWSRDPYLLSDAQWGWIYVIHGVAALFSLSMVMLHIYFAIRPDKWLYTRAMIRGWITETEYRDHHDPDRWPADKT
jgi:cytochrome b subunit of formate dehydrogenase